ncbi:MAG: cysteine desulfurase [FCB group bacterium]|nr:cysteine desulfurase [FCB group bacterium]
MPYFDHSATTPIDPDVLNLLQKVQTEEFGNPSSTHAYGRKARHRIETARKQMAAAIGASSLEIIFTGGGSESNNLVLWNRLYSSKKHVITTAIEHPAILTTLKHLKNFGIRVTVLPVDRRGRVSPEEVARAIESDTGLITIMMANNEIGTIQPLREIGALAKENGILFHSDAVQVPGKQPIRVADLNVDMMSFSAHKFYGPKGVGALYIRQGVKLNPLIIGGGQERRLRAGTENVPGIAALGLAAEKAARGHSDHLSDLETQFRTLLTETIPGIKFNGDPDHHLPGLVSLTVPNPTSDILLIQLDLQELAVSSGSACSSGAVKPSHVLQAIGLSAAANQRTLRISFGKDNTFDEVSLLAHAIGQLCAGNLAN